jgi:hypothetical protein
MQHLDEGMIHAWLDGALSETEGREIEQHAADCPTCSAAIAEARGLIAASSRIVSQLDGAPQNVLPKNAPVKRRAWSRWPIATLAAAAVIFAITFRQRPEPSAPLEQRAMADSAIQAPAALDSSPSAPVAGTRPQAANPLRKRIQTAEAPAPLPPASSTRASAPEGASPMPAPPVIQERASRVADQVRDERRAASGAAGIGARAATAPAAAPRRPDLSAAQALTQVAERPPQQCFRYQLDAAVDPVPQSFILEFENSSAVVRRVAGDSIPGLTFRMSGDSTFVMRSTETIMTLTTNGPSVRAVSGSRETRGTVAKCAS